MRTLALVAVSVLASAGCGSRCKDVARVRSTLTSRAGAPNRGADVQIVVPLARANTVIAELLAQKPLVVPLDAPDLGPLQISTTLTATVKSLVLEPGPPGKVRVAVVLSIDDPAQQITSIEAVAELEPVVTADELSIGVGPENVVKLRPTLGPAAQQQLGSAVTRWMPDRLKSKIPQAVVDIAASKLGTHLTGAAWTVLQKTLFVKLGELTRVKLRLPDVPVAAVDLASVRAPDALVVGILTNLPVRAGLSAGASASSDVTVRISGSAAAELANWAIDEGHAPQWYTRSLKPSPSGEFRPRFDYLAGSSHPLKVYAFQQRGGCSYFKVGVAAGVKLSKGQLVATATDRELEAQNANPVIEAAAWVKFFTTGWVNRSKKVAAHTQLTIGGRTLLAEVTSAEHARGELAFGLAFSGDPQTTALNGSGASRPSAGSSGGIKNSSR
jgi:hypothetical protein